jgi:hypothetical protein
MEPRGDGIETVLILLFSDFSLKNEPCPICKYQRRIPRQIKDNATIDTTKIERFPKFNI